MTRQSSELLFDADVLIDFYEVDPSIIRLIAENIAVAHVVTPVLSQVTGLTEKKCTRIKLLVERPTEQELDDVRSLHEAISFEDMVCLIVSKERGWTCVTNDTKLRACCQVHGVVTRRGLRLLIDLFRAGAITKREAARLADQISERNPGHIGPAVVSEFKRELDRNV